jgi:hypothetical protein
VEQLIQKLERIVPIGVRSRICNHNNFSQINTRVLNMTETQKLFNKKLFILTTIFIISIASLMFCYSLSIYNITDQYNAKINNINIQTIDMINNGSANTENLYSILATIANSSDIITLDNSWHMIENNTIVLNSTRYSEFTIPNFSVAHLTINGVLYSNTTNVAVQLFFPTDNWNITSKAYLLTGTAGNPANYQS